jgi:fructosamine-3-kinase
MRTTEVEAALGEKIYKAAQVAGGDINQAFKVELVSGKTVFVKWQDRDLPGMFASEAAGLEWLRPGPIRIPKVLAHGGHWIALEWLDITRAPSKSFGHQLAQLHQLGAPSFGLDRANYLATLPQDNTPEPDWPTFYVERRLRPLCKRAELGVDRELDTLRARPELFGPPEPPARLHGDLWSGNTGSVSDETTIFDPAVYGGHREIDIAMLALFGGLPDGFIDSYEQVLPLALGWRDRIALHQLYPLAAHACLFGGGYGPRVTSLLATLLR